VAKQEQAPVKTDKPSLKVTLLKTNLNLNVLHKGVIYPLDGSDIPDEVIKDGGVREYLNLLEKDGVIKVGPKDAPATSVYESKGDEKK
jgi:hypothetical protein